jgi:uncharacterized membrane protein YfcA
MNQYIIEFIFGLIGGLFLGVTSILPSGLILVAFEYLNIGTYKTNLGTIALLNLFPITIGSFWNFHKTNNVNYSMGLILLISIIFGSYIGSNLVVGKKYELSTKTIQYITAFLGLFIFITFFIKAYFS